MSKTTVKYREYFDVDEQYFPCIDDAAINAGAPWENTYPHTSFLNMLTAMERALARQNNGKTLWIEGAYGTGKSQCAHALRKILEVPEAELRDYWSKYSPLESKMDLLEKLIGHKKKGIVVAYRYASGGIMSPRDLFFAIQESVKSALERQKIKYQGENTLKESVIAWLEDVDHKAMFNNLLKNSKKEWGALFSQASADEVLNSLRKNTEIKSLMGNIFRLADEEGVTALSIDSQRLINWLTDIIDTNGIQIVFIWDEFSDYFRNNRESLSEFQKIAALVQSKPFYFIVVTHEPQKIYIADSDRGNQTKVSDRFISIPITLPDNIAFDLIGHAFNVKSAAKANWDALSGELNNRLTNSREEVMKAAKIDDPDVIKNIMPLHPIAALLLKNIASSFQSNQRSMFDFIKSSNIEDVKAFQWFIENTGPHDDHPLLTVDMLWNFFYEKGRDHLTSDIRMILDIFPQQQNLLEEEKTVLKAILIMQAVDQRLGGAIPLFKATDQNLSYVFEGVSYIDGTISGSIAKNLRKKGILVSNPIDGGHHVYAAAVLAGDQAKIDKHKADVKENSATSKLVNEGGLSTMLSLSPALRLRFENEPGSGQITTVTAQDFTKKINDLRNRAENSSWKFYAVIAFAKDESEAASFRKTLKAAVADKKYENIVFIDALSTPLGAEAFEQYVEYSAMAGYYQGQNTAQSRDFDDKAKRVLSQDWKNRLYNGQFCVYTYTDQEGKKHGNAQGVASALQTIVQTKFPSTFDFTNNLTEAQLKNSNATKSAKLGIMQATSGVMVNAEKHLLPTVWKVDQYWKKNETASLPISKIKIEIEKLIEEAFDSEGSISIGDIYDFLEKEYGFAPCNLSSFLCGFLLKEYGVETYRYGDSHDNQEPMTQDKLAEMIGNYITYKVGHRSQSTTYIVKMTPDEMAFYTLTEAAWRLTPGSYSSAGQITSAISQKMRDLSLPVWCLKEVDRADNYDIIQKYIELVQKEGKEAHNKVLEIGRASSIKSHIAGGLKALLTKENCQKGMRKFLQTFEGGEVLTLAKNIGVEENVLAEISRLFCVKYACLWDKQTGEDEIRKLLTIYGLIGISNTILNTSERSLPDVLKKWCEKLKFIGISSEALRTKYPSLSKVIDSLIRIFKQEELLPDQLKDFRMELDKNSENIKGLFDNRDSLFVQIYKPYLEGLTDNDIVELQSKLRTGLFELSETECNTEVKRTAETLRANQVKTKLFELWRKKTNTKNPNDWSYQHRTPILSCVSESEFESAKKAFDTLNRNGGPDKEIESALNFLETTTLFENLTDQRKIDEYFMKDIIGEYAILLSDIKKVRNSLDHLSVDPYNWRENPTVKEKIKQLAEAEYYADGIVQVNKIIDIMDNNHLKDYLKRLVKASVTVGIEILAKDGGEQK